MNRYCEHKESEKWYTSANWTHSYYQKSHTQSTLEDGVSETSYAWNKPRDAPTSTVGVGRPIYTRPTSYDPIGPGYRGMWDLDRIQLRNRYSRYTMPDVQTTSLRSVQNPLTRHIPLPCIRDQKTLLNSSNYYHCLSEGTKEQIVAYKEHALKHSGELYTEPVCTTPCLQVSNHLYGTPPEASPHEWKEVMDAQTTDSMTKKSVTWADPLSVNSNNNNNNCDVTRRNREELFTDYCHKNCNRRKVLTSGRYYHFMDTNSEHCQTDLPIDYKNQEQSRYTGLQSRPAHCNRPTVHHNSEDMMNSDTEPPSTDQLAPVEPADGSITRKKTSRRLYNFDIHEQTPISNTTGETTGETTSYTECEVTKAPDTPPRFTSTLQTTYQTYFNRVIPEYEYGRSRAEFGHVTLLMNTSC